MPRRERADEQPQPQPRKRQRPNPSQSQQSQQFPSPLGTGASFSSAGLPTPSIPSVGASVLDTPGYESISPATTHDTAPQALNFLAPEMRSTLEEYLDTDPETPRAAALPMVDAVSAGLVSECDACFLFRRWVRG